MFRQQDKTRVLIRQNRDIVFEKIYPSSTNFENINPMLLRGRVKNYSHISTILTNLFKVAFYTSIKNNSEQSRQAYVNLYKQLFIHLSGLNDVLAENDAALIANNALDNAIKQHQSNKKSSIAILYEVKTTLLCNLNLFQENTASYKDKNTYLDFFSTVAKHINDDMLPLEHIRLSGKKEYDVYPVIEQLMFTNPMKSIFPKSSHKETLNQIYSRYKAACAFAIHTLRADKDNNLDETLYCSQMNVLKNALEQLTDQPTQSNINNFVNCLKQSSDIFLYTKNVKIIALFKAIGCNVEHESEDPTCKPGCA